MKNKNGIVRNLILIPIACALVTSCASKSRQEYSPQVRSPADSEISDEKRQIRTAQIEEEVRLLKFNRRVNNNKPGGGNAVLDEIRITNRRTFAYLSFNKNTKNVCFHSPGENDSFFLEYTVNGDTRRANLTGLSTIYRCPNRGDFNPGDTVAMEFSKIDEATAVEELSLYEGNSAVAGKRGFWDFSNLIGSSEAVELGKCEQVSSEVCLITTWGPDVCSLGFDEFAASSLDSKSYDIATSPICGKLISDIAEREFSSDDAMLATITGGLDDLGQAGVDSENIILKGGGWGLRMLSFSMKASIYDSCMRSCR